MAKGTGVDVDDGWCKSDVETAAVKDGGCGAGGDEQAMPSGCGEGGICTDGAALEAREGREKRVEVRSEIADWSKP